MDGRDLGRGLIAHDAARAAEIMGRNSKAIAEALGASGRDEMIHRDDLALA